MHGIVFVELRKFVNEKLGAQAWNELLKNAGLTEKVYMPIAEYPDAEIVSLASTAASMTGNSVAQVLEGFGEFIASDLLGMYRTLVRPEWKTLDLLEHTEKTIHEVVRMKNRGASPPRLTVERLGADRVMIHYSSQRLMCALAMGIVKGLAKHYKEEVKMEQTRCMLEGAPACLIVVETVASV